MTSISDAAAWPVFIGTARGAAHESRHAPNQDSAGSQVVTADGGVAVAVADGHGAARHFRSSTGSMLAVRAALAVAAELVAAITEPWPAATADALRGELPRAVVARWRELVARDLAAHPFSADEMSALERAQDGPEIPYGSTLLVGLVVTDWLVCAQIGDGDMLAVRPDGRAWIPVGGDDRLDGFRTTSLCQAGAVGSFRTAAYDLRTEPLLALQLTTDGYGNAQAADPWQPAVAADLAGLAAERDRGWFEQQIQRWAERCASAQGSGDDTTIALLLAPDSARLAGARPAAAAPPPGMTAPSRPRRFRRQAAAAGIAGVIAAAGIAIGLLASQSSGSATAPATPTAGPAPKATPDSTQPAPKAMPTAASPGGAQPRGSNGNQSNANHSSANQEG
jgi:Protein phosphatase 2C